VISTKWILLAVIGLTAACTSAIDGPAQTDIESSVQVASAEPDKAAEPTATPTQSPGLTQIAQPTEFVSSKDYGEFDVGMRTQFQAAVDNEFSALEEKAGISVAVYTNETLWTYAVGEADEDVNMTVETPLLISSTSKTFLSALILAQIEKGLYELTDSLGTVLANHPDFSSFPPDEVNPEVTIEDMLTMSSGMADFSYNMEGKSASYKQPVWTPSDTVDLIPSPYSVPGNFKYNDTNVVLLGIVAEFYGEESLANLYREAFTNPLKMTAVILPEEGIAWHTQLFNDQADDFTSPRMAMPYTDVSPWGGLGFGNMIQTAPFGFGYYLGAVGRLRYGCCGIISIPEDVARWAYELYGRNGSAISESARDQLLNSFSETRVPPWGVTNESYGYLASKRTFILPDSTIITAYGHPGGGGGYASLMLYSAELDLSISILANSEMSFRGFCGPEKPMNCIASDIFAAYSNTEGR
jgi:CubicO group peptidase (beta-lactamase class C family)